MLALAVAAAALALLPARDKSGQARGEERTLAYRLALPQVVRDGLSPLNQGEFATSASAVRTSTNVAITAIVRATTESVVVVDVEVYGAGGQRVYQGYYDGAVLRAGQPRTFTWTWTPEPNLPAGQYIVKLGIFAPGPEWQQLFHWNDAAATVSWP